MTSPLEFTDMVDAQDGGAGPGGRPPGVAPPVDMVCVSRDGQMVHQKNALHFSYEVLATSSDSPAPHRLRLDCLLIRAFLGNSTCGHEKELTS
jgi:hypothetical protein